MQMCPAQIRPATHTQSLIASDGDRGSARIRDKRLSPIRVKLGCMQRCMGAYAGTA